jgi:acetate kinase
VSPAARPRRPARRRTSQRSDRILVLNAGSSTLKASLLRRGLERPLADVTVDWAGPPEAAAAATLEHVLVALGDPDAASLIGAGHRVVHGGPDLVAPVVIDPDSLAAIEAVADLAPLHVPPAVAVIRALTARAPDLRQVACFDTAFHARMPQAVRRYPVPAAWFASDGIRRYGFHGLSVEWSVGRAATLLGSPPRALRLVVAHLGAGASVTAVDRGRSVHTSMGYTPLEGLMMATRSGSIDPGIIFERLRGGRHEAASVEEDLVHRSGLLGIGGSADLRVLLERSTAGDDAARLAIEMFVDRAAAAIAAGASRLPRLDAVVFTGGIGEYAGAVRAAIVRRLVVLGIEPISRAARRGDVVLSAPEARPAVVRVRAREDLVIAAAVVRARPVPVSSG